MGLGTWHHTWHAFGEGRSGVERRQMTELLAAFLRGGGRVIDSSPAHEGAESALGRLLREQDGGPRPFVATKIRAASRREGERQLAGSLDRLGHVDLVQVHNMLEWATQLSLLSAARDSGRIRYVGVTHYSPQAFEHVERLMRARVVDFVQIPYSLHLRTAEERLLPAAIESGTAVIVMLPFEAGGLFSQLHGRPLPPWTEEIGCTSWAQVFLKFVLAHPAVTCVIPATATLTHLEDNLRATEGPLPEVQLRARMVREVG